MVNQKETEILSIFESQNTATSGQENDSSIGNQSPLPVVGEFPGAETSPYMYTDRNILAASKPNSNLAGFESIFWLVH